MEQLDRYNKVLNEIYDYFGFKEDWTIWPIDDRRQYWWQVNRNEVHFYTSKDAYENNDESRSFTNEILHHRFYPNSIYKGEKYTMIAVDTQTDGNKFLAIYDNSKKL